MNLQISESSIFEHKLKFRFLAYSSAKQVTLLLAVVIGVLDLAYALLHEQVRRIRRAEDVHVPHAVQLKQAVK